VTAGEVLAALGAILTLSALLARRISLAVVLLFFGSLFVGFAIAVLASPAAGAVVATLYAGLLVTLIVVALMVVVEEKELRLDSKHFYAVVLGIPAAYLLAAALIEHGKPGAFGILRTVSAADVGAVALLAVATALGIAIALWGGEER